MIKIKSGDKIKSEIKNNNIKDNFTEWFIDKTFSVIVDIPILEQSNWRTYFKEEIIKAFWEEKIDLLNMWYLISSFYELIIKNDKKITPREIINYINELVSNYMFFEDDIPLLHQWIYILLKRYNYKYLKDIDNKELIKNPIKLKRNNIFKNLSGVNFNNLYEDLLKQLFKSEEVYNIIFWDKFIESLKNWDYEEVKEILDKINWEDKKDGLIEKSFKNIKDDYKSIDVLWKIAFSILNLDNSKLNSEWKDLIQEIINIWNIDKKSSQWIVKLLEKYNNKHTTKIKEDLPSKMLEEIILSNKSKEDE